MPTRLLTGCMNLEKSSAPIHWQQESRSVAMKRIVAAVLLAVTLVSITLLFVVRARAREEELA